MTKLPEREEKKHRHKWEDHCDCEYCELKVCLKCGDEKQKDIYRKK